MKTKMMVMLGSSKGQKTLKVAAVVVAIVAMVLPGTALADGVMPAF